MRRTHNPNTGHELSLAEQNYWLAKDRVSEFRKYNYGSIPQHLLEEVDRRYTEVKRERG